MDDCLFCKILKGELPSDKVFENDDVYAFLDITPNNPGHTLVIPKRHYTNIYEISKNALAEITLATQKLAIAIKEAVKADGVNVVMNNDAAAGQVIFHVHMHIIPRRKNDGFTHWKGTPYTNSDEARKIAEQIKEKLR